MADAPATGAPPATDVTPPPTNQLDPNVGQPPPPPENDLGENGKKVLDIERTKRRELEARLKELEPLAQAAKDAEEANKSELQKATERLAKESDARKLAEQALMVQTVGVEKGLSAQLIKFLTGSTKAEVEANADELLKAMGDNKPTMPGRPTERMVNGKPSGNQLDALDPVTLIRMGRGEQIK